LPRDQGGTFAAPQKLLDKAGNVLRLGQYWDYEAKKWTGVETSAFKEQLGIGAAAVDWERDGDLDLVLGSFQGQFFVRLNEGTPQTPAFAMKSVQLKAADVPIEVPGRDAIPKVADWDGDGRFDLLSGSGSGGVYWLRNVGSETSPEFAPPEEIVRPAELGNTSTEPTWPGQRTQVCPTDYDGDGDLDLLVGDYQDQGAEMHGWVWLFRRE